MQKSLLRVGIMGAGQMAQAYDSPESIEVKSLAHAVERTEGLELCGFYDVNVVATEDAEIRWSCPPSPREREQWLAERWDVVLIATPNENHAQDLADVLGTAPLAVLVEKPLSLFIEKAELLLRQAIEQKICVLVNFPRRFHSGLNSFSWSNGSDLGSIRSIQGYYSGEFKHSAVHMLDLLSGWLDAPSDLNLLAKTSDSQLWQWVDRGKRIDAWFSKAPYKSAYLWELSVLTDLGRLELSGVPEMMVESRIGTHPLYPTFNALLKYREELIDGEPLLERVMKEIEISSRDKVLAINNTQDELRRLMFLSDIFNAN